MISSTLPIPTTEALNASQQLTEYILENIRNLGRLSFAEYMELALYAPNLGYYAAGAKKWGHGGDFITAPELSPLFAQCLAHQCSTLLQELENGSILEIGAGSGKMAIELLLELDKLNTLPKHYDILELSADLQQRQQENMALHCPQFLPLIRWLNKLPDRFEGIILANEVLDAMPVHRFQITEQDIQETCVIEKNGKFAWQNFPVENNRLAESIAHLQSSLPLGHFCSGYSSEINLNLKPWILSLSDVLERGMIILIDYGFSRGEYYHPDRHMGTLMCHYRHYAQADPFLYPGLQDITAHVDFTAIAEAALDAHLDVLGFTNQAAFLLGSGLLEIATISNASEKEIFKQNHAIQVLTSPAEMGELFKVMALGRNIETIPSGFNLVDKRYSL